MADGSLTREEFWKLSLEERCERYKDLSDHDKFLVRLEMNPGVISPVCNDCVHYWDYAKCAAYPNRISGEHMRLVTKDPTLPCGKYFHFERK